MDTIITNADLEYMSMNLETYNGLRDLVSRVLNNIVNTVEFRLLETKQKDYLSDPKNVMFMPWAIARIDPNIFMPYSVVNEEGKTIHLLDLDDPNDKTYMPIAKITDGVTNTDKPRPQFVADDMEAIAKRMKEIQKEKEHGVDVSKASIPSPSAPTYHPTY